MWTGTLEISIPLHQCWPTKAQNSKHPWFGICLHCTRNILTAIPIVQGLPQAIGTELSYAWQAFKWSTGWLPHLSDPQTDYPIWQIHRLTTQSEWSTGWLPIWVIHRLTTHLTDTQADYPSDGSIGWLPHLSDPQIRLTDMCYLYLL